jgi:hypothetical protein
LAFRQRCSCGLVINQSYLKMALTRKESIMAFDPEKDVSLFHEKFVNGDTHLHLDIRQYNGGEKKVQITREVLRKNEMKFAKMGRLTAAEFAFITAKAEKVLNIVNG